jgi:hypothetical protein
VTPFEGRCNSLEKGGVTPLKKGGVTPLKKGGLTLEKGRFGNRKAGAGRTGRRSVLRGLSEIVE